MHPFPAAMLAAGSAAALRPQDVFATSLYTGSRQARSITSGIDLTSGGLTWIKGRSNNPSHAIFDTARGVGNFLSSDQTAAEIGSGITLTAFTATGFNLGTDTDYNYINAPSQTYAAWSFKRKAKFFDIVTYAGDGTSGRQIPHGLGIAPGLIIIKRRDAASANYWPVYHRSVGANKRLALNLTDAVATSGAFFPADPTDSVFTLGTYTDLNASGGTYVAYLFAHDPDTTNGIIQCGSFTTDASGLATVNLGWSPQWSMMKRADAAQDWFIRDKSRGWSSTNFKTLSANQSAAETSVDGNFDYPTATDFKLDGGNYYGANAPFVHVTIRAPT